jgi:hypothetical protein
VFTGSLGAFFAALAALAFGAAGDAPSPAPKPRQVVVRRVITRVVVHHDAPTRRLPQPAAVGSAPAPAPAPAAAPAPAPAPLTTQSS